MPYSNEIKRKALKWLTRKRERLELISGNTEVTNKNKNLLVP